jgi:hypothetical protein
MADAKKSHDSLPESDPVLDALIARVQDPSQIRGVCLSYWEQVRGIPCSNISGFDKHAPAKPLGSDILSRVVTLPSGARCLLDGARSEEELDCAEAELRRTRS